MSKAKLEPPEVCKTKCATCPFKEGSAYAYLATYLSERSMVEARICHSTSVSAIKRTKTTAKICRGSRDIQLRVMFEAGVITAPTDEAWKNKVDEINKQNGYE